MKLRTRGLFSVGRLRRTIADRLHGTPFDQALASAARAGRFEFVFGWNRGLGDIALGLVPLFARIRSRIAPSRIVLVTRPDLEQMAALSGADEVVVVAGLVRDAPFNPVQSALAHGIVFRGEPTVFADPDPTRWLDGQRTTFAPRLAWNPALDAGADRFVVPAEGRLVIGAHVNSETAQYYGYVKDWPTAAWRALFAQFPASRGVQWLLFGNVATPQFDFPNVTDVRGATSMHELLALVRRHCRVLVAPDSGILTAVYYLDQMLPLEVVSLWSDPRQGVLKQGCASPNPALRHHPLQGRGEDVRNLTVPEVEAALATVLASLPPEDGSRAAHAL